MPGPLDQLPPDATTLARRVKALERLVRELMASRRGSNATIGGGTTTITGARIQTATDGPRVVLDSVDGSLQVYDADGNLTNYVGGDSNIIFNQAGFPVGEYVAMNVGNLLLGVGNGLDADLSGAGAISVIGSGDAMSSMSPANAANSDRVFLIWRSGDPAAAQGAATRRRVEVDGDQWITGAVIKAEQSGNIWTQATWQTPTWGSGWSGTTTLNGMSMFRSLQARLMAEDDVWVLGGATTTGTSGSIGTLPAEMWPPADQRVLLDAYFFKPGSPTGTVSMGKVQITEAGVLNASQSLGGIAISSGVQVFVNGRYPLGNLA